MTQPTPVRPTFSRNSLPTGPWRAYRPRIFDVVSARRIPVPFTWRKRDGTTIDIEDGWVLEHSDGSIEVLEAGQFAAAYEILE